MQQLQANGTFDDAILNIRLAESVFALSEHVAKLMDQFREGAVEISTDQWVLLTTEVLARKVTLDTAFGATAVPYHEHRLGETAHDVLKAFYAHQGEMNLKPFGFDVYQGFEFFCGDDNKLYKRIGVAVEEFTNSEEELLFVNVGSGAVEFYLRHPSLGIAPFIATPKKVLHAATGRPIPTE